MSYLNAPQTKMLATHCAVCRRPLCDAQSVELAIGPDCREKHGFNIDVDPVRRNAANVMVYQIAIHNNEPMLVMEYCNGLRELGFVKLSGIILKRLADVEIIEANGVLTVRTPFSEASVEGARGIPGRRWDKTAKANTFPITSKRQVFAYLTTFFALRIAIGPKGAFVIPVQGQPAAPKFVPTPEYLANAQKIDAEEDAREARKAAMDDDDVPDQVCQRCLRATCLDGCCAC